MKEKQKKKGRGRRKKGGEEGEKCRKRRETDRWGGGGRDGGRKEEKNTLSFPLGVLLEPQSCDDHFVILTKKRPEALKNHQLRGLTC